MAGGERPRHRLSKYLVSRGYGSDLRYATGVEERSLSVVLEARQVQMK